MIKSIRILLLATAVLIFGLVNVLQGQNQGTTPNNNNNAQIPKDDQVTNQLADLRKIEIQAMQDAIRTPQPFSDKIRRRYITILENRLLREDVYKLKPDQQYYIQFAEFLKNKNTGLARILPDRKCDQGFTVTVKELERCADSLTIRGGGSFYSFRNRTNLNQSGKWADLQLVDAKFVVGINTQFGLIKELGEGASLDNLNVKSEEISFLLKYKPKVKFQDVKLEKELLEKGQIDNFSSSANLNPGSVYILRSIAYKLKIIDIVDNRADIIVAFKVIAQERDGSVVLLWKQLKSNTPKKLKEL